jgi:hypothetical protein
MQKKIQKKKKYEFYKIINIFFNVRMLQFNNEKLN